MAKVTELVADLAAKAVEEAGCTLWDVEYVREAGLLGIMYWEHSCDRTHQLLQVIHRELGTK